MIRFFFSPTLPLMFFGLILIFLALMIFLYPKLLAWFVAIFLLLQGMFFMFLGLIMRIGRGRRSRTTNEYRDIEIRDM